MRIRGPGLLLSTSRTLMAEDALRAMPTNGGAAQGWLKKNRFM
jgi:hypothetical protein